MADKDRGAKSAGTEDVRAEPAVESTLTVRVDASAIAELCATVATLATTVEELRQRLAAFERRFRHY